MLVIGVSLNFFAVVYVFAQTFEPDKTHYDRWQLSLDLMGKSRAEVVELFDALPDSESVVLLAVSASEWPAHISQSQQQLICERTPIELLVYGDVEIGFNEVGHVCGLYAPGGFREYHQNLDQWLDE